MCLFLFVCRIFSTLPCVITILFRTFISEQILLFARFSEQILVRRAISSWKIVFLRGMNVQPAFKQYKIQGNASNLVQSHFGSPPLRMLDSGIAHLVPRGFDPAYWGLNQPPPSRSTTHTANWHAANMFLYLES